MNIERKLRNETFKRSLNNVIKDDTSEAFKTIREEKHYCPATLKEYSSYYCQCPELECEHLNLHRQCYFFKKKLKTYVCEYQSIE